MEKKAQTSIEFFVLIGALFFFFIVFLALLNATLTDKNFKKKDIAINEIANALIDEINLAQESGEGYYREFRLPVTILEFNYNATLDFNSIYIISQDGKHAASFPISNVSGQPIVNNTNIIRKQNGMVLLN